MAAASRSRLRRLLGGDDSTATRLFAPWDAPLPGNRRAAAAAEAASAAAADAADESSARLLVARDLLTKYCTTREYRALRQALADFADAALYDAALAAAAEVGEEDARTGEALRDFEPLRPQINVTTPAPSAVEQGAEADADPIEALPPLPLLVRRFWGSSPASPSFHATLATRVAAWLTRATEQALRQWPYAESRHVALLQRARLRSPAAAPSTGADREWGIVVVAAPSFRSQHIIPFLSDAVASTGVDLPLFADAYCDVGSKLTPSRQALTPPQGGDGSAVDRLQQMLQLQLQLQLQLAQRLGHLTRLQSLLRARKAALDAAARAADAAAREAAAADAADAAAEMAPGTPRRDDQAETFSAVAGAPDVAPTATAASGIAAAPVSSDTARAATSPSLDGVTSSAPTSEAAEVLRNALEAQLLRLLYPAAFLRCADDCREQLEADRALGHVAAAAIAVPGGVRPASEPLPGALAQIAVPRAVQDAGVLRLCVAQLQRLNREASAEAKMEVVADTCALLSAALRTRNSSAGAEGGGELTAVGADELIPALMWVVLFAARLGAAGGDEALRCAPLRLTAHCCFIERFRDPSQMFGRAAYCLTHLRSVLQFLVTLGLVAVKSSESSSQTPVAGCSLCGNRVRELYARFCTRCGSPREPIAGGAGATPLVSRGAYV